MRTEPGDLQTRERAIEAAANAFVIADMSAPDQPIIDVNPAFTRMTGYNADDILGRNCRFLQGPDTDPRAVQSMRTAIDNHAEITLVLLNYRKDGSPFWNELYLSPMVTSSGAVTHYVGIQNDVSARVREAELRIALAAEQAANLLKGQFLSTMSHELRTPLTAITGYTDLLAMDSALSPVQSSDVAEIARGAGRLLRLIEDVLQLAELTAGAPPLSHQWVDLGSITAAALANEKPVAVAKGLQLEAIAPVGIQALADPGALSRVLTALINNAVKFTASGSVRVRVRGTGDGVAEVEVADTGPGIPAAALPHIFAAFRQADGTSARRFGGAGLGLAIADQLMRLLGGMIRVETSTGAGSVFTVVLPSARINQCDSALRERMTAG